MLTDRSFAYWDPGTGETNRRRARMPLRNMVTEGERPAGRVAHRPGPYVLHVGRSSADIAWTVTVNVNEVAPTP